MADAGGVDQPVACARGGCRPGGRAEPEVLRALVRLASLVTTTGEDDLVEAVAETSRDLLGADSLSISKMDGDGASIATLINVGDLGPGEERRPAHEVYRVVDLPQTLAFLRGEDMPTWVTDVDDPDAEPQELALLDSLGKASSLKTPIRLAGEMWGELWASRSHASPRFDDGDVSLAEVIVALAATAAGTGSLALVLGDVNGLKRCNDTRGHAAGDDALLHVVAEAGAIVRENPGSLVARLGGDEFALVLPGLAGAAALAVAQRWCDLAAHPVHDTSLACGLAVVAPGERADPRDLARAADLALYAAKTARSATPVLAPRAAGAR